MLFDQKEFEHKIEEVKLKKGLKLFAANKVELINKVGNGLFTFFIHEKISGEISIQLKAGKILNYKCYCNNNNFCEHLAASIFYLQQEVLQLLKVKQKPKKKNSIKKIINKKSVLVKYINKIKEIIDPFLEHSKLKKEQASEIYNRINFEKTGVTTFKHDFYFHLAIILELPKFSNFNLDSARDESGKALAGLIKSAKSELELYIDKGLTNSDKDAFIEASYYSLRSQANFRSGSFSFLIAQASILIKDKYDLENLKAQLKKRKQNKNSLDPIDRKLIAELQLSIMIAKSVGKTYSLKDHESTIELPIALAEIEFRKKKYINGFKLLEQYAKKIKDGNINRYLDLIDEILIFANKQNNKIIEEEYLIEKFVYGYYIDEIELIRFFELNTGNTKELRAAELIKKIKGISGLYAFEKIAVILLSQNRLDEIIEEIKREKNKFRLLNKIVIQKFPDFNKDILSLYVKHFLQAITEAKFPYFQEQICNMAKTYLDKLPIDVRKNSLVAIKEKIIFERHAFMYFTKLYPDSF